MLPQPSHAEAASSRCRIQCPSVGAAKTSTPGHAYGSLATDAVWPRLPFDFVSTVIPSETAHICT